MSENLPIKRDSMSLDFNDSDVIKTLKQTVAIGASDAEFSMFAEHCKATGLNPFKREIWFIKAGGRVQIMTGIQGFFAIANSDQAFDGHESGLISPNGEYVSGAYPKNDFIGAWCKVYRKDRRIPSEGIAMLSEYDKKQSNWNTMKRVMITKCAESVALRKAFPQQLNGLYTAEEMPVEYGGKEAVSLGSHSREHQYTEIELPPPNVEIEKPVSNDISNEIIQFGKHKGMPWKDVPTGYLEWLSTQPGRHSNDALIELHRRKQLETSEPDTSAFDNDELPDWDIKDINV